MRASLHACHAMPRQTWPCQAQPCLACHASPSHALPCPAAPRLPCLAAPCLARPCHAKPRRGRRGLEPRCLPVARQSLTSPCRAPPRRTEPNLARPNSTKSSRTALFRTEPHHAVPYLSGRQGLEPRWLPVTRQTLTLLHRAKPSATMPNRAKPNRTRPNRTQPCLAAVGAEDSNLGVCHSPAYCPYLTKHYRALLHLTEPNHARPDTT